MTTVLSRCRGEEVRMPLERVVVRLGTEATFLFACTACGATHTGRPSDEVLQKLLDAGVATALVVEEASA
jgi:hypothetical protein